MAVMERIAETRLRESVFTGRLPSGLEVLVVPRPGFAKKYAAFATHYGSVDSRFRVPGEREPIEVPDGIAHFLEHQLFATEEGDAFDLFSKLGASANAFTSFTTTTYLFSCTDHFEENLRHLLRFVQTPYFTPEGTAKEQGIIVQEIKMYQDDPHWRVSDNLRLALYQRHPFRLDIAGTPETVSQITKELLDRCYRTFYHPSNMVLSVVGDVDPERVAAIAEEEVESRRYAPQPPIERFYPEEPEEVAQPRIEERLSVSRPMLLLGFKERQATQGGRALLTRELATAILLEWMVGRSSPLYNELYEEGLIDASFSASYLAEADFGMSSMGGETDRPEELCTRLHHGIQEARARGIDEAAFQRLKNRSYGEFLGTFNSPESLSYLANSAYFQGIQLFDHLDALEGLTLEVVQRRLEEHFDPRFSAVSLILPKE